MELGEFEAYEWDTLRKAAENKARLLMKQDNKNWAQLGVDASLYKRIDLGGRTFYTISTNVFKVILESHLALAVNKFPKKFGTGKTDDVLEAIYNIEALGDLASFGDRLSNECFCWIFEFTEGNLNAKVLRVDLFRMIKTASNNTSEFIGGILHAFKHFSYNNYPLSTHNQIHNLNQPSEIINYIIQGFFLQNMVPSGNTNFYSELPLDVRYKLRFVFYYEPNTEVYFITTVIKQRI